ncbi:unnamed protein product [Lactuca saligna]|uniref:RBR-type E3 ubiquitin transferase n=1 Tax=Lactuca saligna TaxID=75948 RepID=A0AA35YCV5_LACSI|nr:unnamed protein product [Lactuca saligna]
MASSSQSDAHNTLDEDKCVDVDDFYFSALYDADGDIFPISDENYAQELQLQEALISSVSKTNASSSSQNVASSSSSSSSSQKFESSSLSQNSQTEASSSVILETSQPPNILKRKQPMETSEEAQLPESFCGICMDTKAHSEMFSNSKVCGHQFCSDCIREHVSVKIKENMAEVKCPDPKCKRLIGPELCGSIVPKEVLERWEDALCESLILGTQKFYCPFKDCSAMLVDDGGEAVTSSECPNCHRLFCAQCKVAWHSDMDCNEFKSLSKDERNPEDLMLMQLAKNKQWKRCPRCNYIVEKREGCHHISCRCGQHFCYGCGKEHVGSHACNV